MTYTLKQDLPANVLKRKNDTLVYTNRDKLLNKFREQALVKGVSFKSIVPVVNDFPDCWNEPKEYNNLNKN